jgi:hypothetical protein
MNQNSIKLLYNAVAKKWVEMCSMLQVGKMVMSGWLFAGVGLLAALFNKKALAAGLLSGKGAEKGPGKPE